MSGQAGVVGRCAECGFDWDCSAADAIAELRGAGQRVVAPLTRFLPGEDGDAVIRARPAPEVWSTLEYAAHLRAAFGFYGQRITRVLTEDRPQLHAVGFGSLPEEQTYNAEDPGRVIAHVGQASTQLADVLETLDDASWQRIGIGNDGDERTVLVLARRAAHEVHHHLLDIGRGLRTVRAAARAED